MAAAAISIKKQVENPIDSCLASLRFPLEISTLVCDYVMRRPELFGGAEYLKYFNTNIGNPVLRAEFFSFWNSFDAIDLYKGRLDPRYAYEAHLDPIYLPRGMDVRKLSGLVADPLNGGHRTFIYQGPVPKHHAGTPASQGCFLVLRREVVARNLSYGLQKNYIDEVNRQTGAGYDRESDLIDLATVVAVWHVVNKERFFGDATGVEGRLTLARSKERLGDHPLAIGAFSSYDLLITNNSDDPDENVALAALRKFSDSPS